MARVRSSADLAAGGDQRLVAKRGSYLQARLMQAALEGGLADADEVRRLASRETFDVAQDDRGAVRQRQLLQRALQCRAHLPVLGAPRWPVARPATPLPGP